MESLGVAAKSIFFSIFLVLPFVGAAAQNGAALPERSPNSRVIPSPRQLPPSYFAPPNRTPRGTAPAYVPGATAIPILPMPAPTGGISEERRAGIRNSASRQREQLEDMEFDTAVPIAGPSPPISSNTASQLRQGLGPAASAVALDVAKLKQAVADVTSLVGVAKSIDDLLSDPKGWSVSTLKDAAQDRIVEFFEVGTSLVVNKTFCMRDWGNPDCREVSDIAAEVILTMPNLTGAIDRVRNINEGLDGYMRRKLDELRSKMSQITSTP